MCARKHTFNFCVSILYVSTPNVKHTACFFASQVPPNCDLVPTPRSSHSTTLYGDAMVVVGGTDADGTICNDMYAFDFAVGTALAPPAPCSFVHHEAHPSTQTYTNTHVCTRTHLLPGNGGY